MSIKGFYGFFGYNNLGDELIFEYVKTNYPDSLFFCKEKDKKNNIYKRTDILALLKCEKIIFPGGNIIQDKSSYKSFYFYIFLILVLMIFKKKIYLINNGIGPVSSTFRKKLVNFIIKRSELVSLRTKGDFDSYKDVSSDVIRGADTVFLFSNKNKNRGNNKKRGIIFKSSYFKKKIYIPEDYVLIAFSPEDECFIKENYPQNKCVVLYNSNFNNCIEIISDFKVLFAFPFHGLVMAYISGVKYIFSYPYDEKVKNLMLDIEDEVNFLEDYSIREIVDTDKKNLKKKINILKDCAQRGFEKI